jgi:uncharacterized protein YbjQ (UPF0145 family)
MLPSWPSLLGAALISIFGFQFSEAQQGDAALKAYLQQATAVLTLDEQCDVLSQEGRFAAQAVLTRINELAASMNAQALVSVRDATQAVREAAQKELASGCRGYQEAEKFQSLAKSWNVEAQAQLSILADIDLQTSCKLNTEQYALLRGAADKALIALKTRPDNRWIAARNNRINIVKSRCQTGRGLSTPTNIVV